MTTMRSTPLKQVATISAGQSAPKDSEFSESGIPFIRAGSLERLLSGDSESELELVPEGTAKLRKLKLYPKGTVLFAKSGMSATKERVYVLQTPAYVVSHLAALIPHADVDAKYLRLALNMFPPSVLIRDHAYPAISLGDIENYEIPFPDKLDDQIRIAQLLGRVEGLITQRKQYRQQLDDLLKSVFLEMFGDPVGNEKGWKKKAFSKLLVDIESGKSPHCEARPAADDEWGVLKLGAVTRCYYNESENKALLDETLSSDRHEVKKGDLLFSRKNTHELVAACAYVFSTRPKLLMPDLIFRFVFRNDAEINPIYIWKLLTAESQRKKIQSLASGTAGSMPNISKTNLKEVQLPIPPLPLQDKFADIVTKVEGLKSHYQQSLNDLEALYGVLSQRAFKGELDLSRVSLAETAAKEEHALATDFLQAAVDPPGINLPDTDLLLTALENRSSLKDLLHQWLEAYRGQIVGERFSSERFIAAAQTRLSELHPDPDFELGDSEYEHIKNWVFEALASGKLVQAYDEANNLVQLKTW